MAEFALVIAQQSVHLYRLSRAEAEPVATAGAREDPSAWLAQHMPWRADCSLVSDSLDESYVRSTLPPIWRTGTRQLLLQRRLMQQLPDTPYRAAVLAPSGSWRPPTRASLIGIGQSERIGEWLTALAARQARVKGLWPMSALIALEIDQKASRRPRTDPAQEAKKPAEPASLRPTLALVATPAGLRQVLILGKTPLFSRLALSVNQGSLSAAYVLAEARRTVQYLISQEWLTSAEQPVATQIWLSFDDALALAEVRDDPALDVQSIEVVTDAYALLLPRLKSVSAKLQFLPEASRTPWRAAQIAKTSKIVGLTALALSGLWSAELLWASLAKRSLAQEQVARATAIKQQTRQEVLRAKGDLSQAGLAVATVQAWQQFIVMQPDQLAALQHLAGALKAAPGVELQKILWELPRLQPETAATPATPAPSAVSFQCPKTNDRAAGIPLPAPVTEAAKPAAALLNLTAALPLDLTRRQALKLQDSLLAGLNADGWSAFILKSGVNLNPAQAQAGTLGVAGARSLELCLQKAGR